MLKEWEEVPTFFITSAAKKEGLNEIKRYIEDLNSLFKKENTI